MATVLSTDTNFSILMQVRIVNDSQLVAVNLRQPYLRVIDRRSGRVVAELGRGGNGPGEYVTDPRVGARADGRTVWVFDMQRSTLTRAHLDPKLVASDSSIHFASFGANTYPIGIDDSTVMLVGARDTFALGTISFSTGNVQFTGQRMRFAAESLPMTPLWRSVLSSEVSGCANPHRNRVVRFHQNDGRLQFLSVAGELIAEAETPYRFEPEMERDGRTVWARSGDQRVGYATCVATDTFVFALFSGRHEKSYRPPSRYFPSEAYAYEFLHVFDWSGKLVKVIQLDPPSWWSMDIDPKTLEMYGIVADPEPGIVRYDLRAAMSPRK